MSNSTSTPSPLSKLIRGGATILLGLVVLVGMALFGLEGVDHIPDNALVYVDETKTYYSPPLLWDDSRPFHVAMSVDQIRQLGFRHVSNTPRTDQEWGELSEEFDAVWVYNQAETWTEFRPPDGVCVVPTTKGAIKGMKEYSPDRTHVNAGGFYGVLGHCFIVGCTRCQIPSGNQSDDAPKKAGQRHQGVLGRGLRGCHRHKLPDDVPNFLIASFSSRNYGFTASGQYMQRLNGPTISLGWSKRDGSLKFVDCAAEPSGCGQGQKLSRGMAIVEVEHMRAMVNVDRPRFTQLVKPVHQCVL